MMNRGTFLSSFAPPQAHASSGAQRSLPHQTIDVVDMVLGVSIVAPMLDGQQSLDIRAGVQPDTMLRIVGRGLPSFGGGPHGDLYVRLQVRVPERLTDRPRRLYEQLKASSRSKPS